MAKRHRQRCEIRATASASTAEGKLQRHIRDLGLESVEAYRAWCRENGFNGTVQKGWQERREEMEHLRLSGVQAAADAALQRHIRALGLPGQDENHEEYRAWCERHGLSPSVNKGVDQRRQEQALADRERAQQALSRARSRSRKPEDLIRSLYQGDGDDAELKAPYLRSVRAAFSNAEGEVREALLRLLLQVYRGTGLLGADPVVPDLGPQPGNTFIEALLALARFHSGWIRAPEEWKRESHSARRQFASLARLLLAKYDVPAFMDSAWFKGSSATALQQQQWFVHIGAGQNIRTAGVPVKLTSRAAHHFLEAPADFSIEGAFRWGQVLALGGDEYLARAVAGTRLRELMTQKDEEFWFTVLQFFVNNPMLDQSCIGPMVDYIYFRKFEPLPAAEGEESPGPPEPSFSMKGRTVPALWRRVEEWHRRLAREVHRSPTQWPPSEIGGFEVIETDDESGESFRWSIRQMLTSKELQEDGKEMRHCVASYARSCGKGATSIWSLQVENCATGMSRRVMTIEVNNHRRFVAQARGRCNRTPGGRHSSERLNHAPAILKQWASQQRLGLPKYL